jgi:hypothetical protein
VVKEATIFTIVDDKARELRIWNCAKRDGEKECKDRECHKGKEIQEK